MTKRITIVFDDNKLDKEEIKEIINSISTHIELLIKKYGYFDYYECPLERTKKNGNKSNTTKRNAIQR